MAKMIFQNVRCSYVFVTEPRKKENGEAGNYSVQVLLPKADAQVKKLKTLIKQVLVEKFGAEAAKKLGKYKLPLRDGDEERDGAEYEGMYFMNANSGKKPGLVNKNNEPPDTDDIDEYCYSGAFFHVSVNIYAFDSKDGGKPGVALGLNNVMMRKQGERLDGTVSATNEFEDYAGGDEDTDDFDDDDEW